LVQFNIQLQCSFHAICTKLIRSRTKVDMPLIEHPDNEGAGRCDMQLCPFNGKAAAACICGVDECDKKAHVECCMRRILPNVGKPPLAPLPDNTVCCTRKHYNAIVKLANPLKKLSWHNDGKPETPTVTSNCVLNDWITTPNDCIEHRGKGENGLMKKHFCMVIGAKMNNLTMSERTWESIQTMVTAREESWRSCNDWINNTGQGVLEKSKETFDTIVNKRCPFCYDREPVMIDRAGSNPAVASDDLDNSDGDPEETEVDDDDDDEDDGNKKPAAKASSIRSQSPAGSISVIDSETKEMFSLATSSSADRIKLMTQQHAEVMSIEKQKLELLKAKAASIDWASQREEVSLQFKLCEKHNKMKDDGKSDEFILMVLPQAKRIIDAIAKTDSPKRTSPRKRNRNDS